MKKPIHSIFGEVSASKKITVEFIYDDTTPGKEKYELSFSLKVSASLLPAIQTDDSGEGDKIREAQEIRIDEWAAAKIAKREKVSTAAIYITGHKL